VDRGVLLATFSIATAQTELMFSKVERTLAAISTLMHESLPKALLLQVHRRYIDTYKYKYIQMIHFDITDTLIVRFTYLLTLLPSVDTMIDRFALT